MCKHFLGFLAVLSLAMLMAMPPAVASGPFDDCTCVTSYDKNGSKIGYVINAKGNVIATNSAGPAAVAAGAQLSLPSRIMTGPDSAAAISVGRTCKLDIAANKDVEIDAVEAKLCVKIADSGQAAIVTPAADLPPLTVPPTNYVPIIVGLGAVGGIAALVILTNDNNGVSK